MMQVKRPKARSHPENTIALINVVFLMLIFFLIAGTLAPSPDREVELVNVTNAVRTPPPDMLFLRQDGTPTWSGEPIALGDAVLRWRERGGDLETPFRLAIDKNLAGLKLIETVNDLRTNGVGEIRLITLADVAQ
ncbi:MAG: biopolymer transporter ExbD [Ahrensia sp.]|nr:biopolymer transporter ExbD [Ahrensia sp.]